MSLSRRGLLRGLLGATAVAAMPTLPFVVRESRTRAFWDMGPSFHRGGVIGPGRWVRDPSGLLIRVRDSAHSDGAYWAASAGTSGPWRLTSRQPCMQQMVAAERMFLADMSNLERRIAVQLAEGAEDVLLVDWLQDMVEEA